MEQYGIKRKLTKIFISSGVIFICRTYNYLVRLQQQDNKILILYHQPLAWTRIG